jgi:hypothetical protein
VQASKNNGIESVENYYRKIEIVAGVWREIRSYVCLWQSSAIFIDGMVSIPTLVHKMNKATINSIKIKTGMAKTNDDSQ